MTTSQRLMLFALWNDLRKILRAQRVPAKECDARRHEITAEALGYQRSWSEDWKNEEVDKVKARLLALLQPDDMDAQLEAMKQPLNRHLFVVDQLCRQLGATRAYADGIAKRMNHEGRLGASTVDELDKDDLEKVLTALRTQVTRRRKTKPTPEPAAVAAAPDPDWSVS